VETGTVVYGLNVYRVPVLLGAAAVVAGLAVALSVGSLVGDLLIIGGVGALGWTMVPAPVGCFVRWLSVGR
jgi:hypothetical protein